MHTTPNQIINASSQTRPSGRRLPKPPAIRAESVLLLVAVCAAIVAAGARAHATIAPGSIRTPSQTQLAKMQNTRRDAVIRRNVLLALTELRAPNYRNIKVSVSRGIVTLLGRVPTIKMRARAERVAAAVPGVRLVINKLEMTGPTIRKSAY